MIRAAQKRFDAGSMRRVGKLANEPCPTLGRFVVPAQCEKRFDSDHLALLTECPNREPERVPVGEGEGDGRTTAQG
jgi:hypothetical protein